MMKEDKGQEELKTAMLVSTSELNQDEKESLLDWTNKQGRILTCNGRAEEYYTPERGFSYATDECPHYHLIHKSTENFYNWAMEREKKSKSTSDEDRYELKITNNNPVCGTYFRPLFVGGWEHSTDDDEFVYNVQTNTLFIDLRVPKLGRRISSLKDGHGWGEYTDQELKLMARRHAFAGYTKWGMEKASPSAPPATLFSSTTERCVCTRHHCIDYNFVGVPRPRPNKWYAEMKHDKQTWKEWAYAKDEFGQHYYWERWERYERDGKGGGLVLALRKDLGLNTTSDTNDERDGIVVVVGDHFNYILDRKLKNKGARKGGSSAIQCIDGAIESDDRVLAESYMSMDAGHGLISNGWTIDCALHPWKEGTQFLTKDSISIILPEGEKDTDSTLLENVNVTSCKVVINGCTYNIYECNVTVEKLGMILRNSQHQKSAACANTSASTSTSSLDSILFHEDRSITACRKRKVDH